MGVYIINKKKYDTNKMELISNKFRYEYEVNHLIFWWVYMRYVRYRTV